MKKPPRVYWDSSCFIAWLKPEKERRKQCKEVLDAAERGELEIVSSAVSLVEVIKLDKGPLQIDQAKEKKIRDFFLRRYILVAQVTRWTAELARQLIWSAGLRPRDSIHIATAIELKVPQVHCFDKKLLGLNGKVFEGHPLRVLEPGLDQASIDFGEEPDLDEEGAQMTAEEAWVDLEGLGEAN